MGRKGLRGWTITSALRPLSPMTLPPSDRDGWHSASATLKEARSGQEAGHAVAS